MIVKFHEAVKLLKNDEVVAVPSETVFGLAASIHSPRAIRKIFSLKGRPPINPLIVHFSSVEQILEFVDIDAQLLVYLKSMWPGPLTLVAPLKKELDTAITAGLNTLAVRIPNHPVFLDLIREVGPLAAPSANRSGLPSATRAWHIEEDYDGQVPMVEGAPPIHGLESTIIIQKEGYLEIGRLGATPIERLREHFTIHTTNSVESAPICPGQLLRHYSPNCELTNNISADFEAIVGYGDVTYHWNLPLYNLGSKQDPSGIARNLYEMLRRLDVDKIKKAFVDLDIPSHGLYAPIQERLSRALVKKTNLQGGIHV
ncbi:threonylcarbamoyl-AMP synthase [bacterium]|nr:threonylcarbamoyl-AMP synthase [bacterium]